MTPAARRTVPNAGQESVWDDLRPPRLERTRRHIVIDVDGALGW